MANKYSSISLRVLMFIAWRNLMNKKMRTALTLAGIVVGVSAIFFLLSFGLGIQKLVTNRVVGDDSIKSIVITTPNSQVTKLNSDLFQKIKGLPRVTKIGSTYSYPGTLSQKGSVVDSIVYGVDSNYMQMSKLRLKTGRLLKNDDDKQVVINMAVVKSIGLKDANQAIGSNLKVEVPALRNQSGKGFSIDYKIVGVSEDTDGNEVYIKGNILPPYGASTLSQIKVESDSVSGVRNLRTQIQTLGLQTSSPVDTIDQINQVFKFFNVILLALGGIGMVVAVLGMFNTLTISLLERTKEIGLMVALGGRDGDMRRLFVFEALLLSFAGSVIGITFAMFFGQAINLLMNFFAKKRGVAESFQMFSMPWWLILGSIAFMMTIGLLVVFMPARRASKINPIDALRRE